MNADPPEIRTGELVRGAHDFTAAGEQLGSVFVERHVEALAARQRRIEQERNVLVRLFCLMHRHRVIDVEYGAIGCTSPQSWSESLSYDEDVVLRRILNAGE